MKLTHDTETPDVETASEAYRSRFTGAVGAFFLETQKKAVQHLLGSVGGGPLRVLELGGGHGQLTEGLIDARHNVVVQGSRLSTSEYLRKTLQQKCNKVPFVISNLWELPFADRTFDVVIAVRLLAHVERWRELLGEMARVSRSAIIFDYASLSALNRLTPLLFNLKRRIEGNTRPYFSYRAADLEATIKNFGFAVIAQEKQFVLPMGLHRKLKSERFSRGAESAFKKLGLASRIGSPVLLVAKRQP